MMKLPELKLKSASANQIGRLKRWLNEWEIDQDLCAQDLRAGSDVNAEETDFSFSVSPIGEESSPQVGQIRLFSPEICTKYNQPLYVAVLKHTANNMYCVAPYGRFAEPCLPGELLTGRDVCCLRVLCLWNAVELSSVLLKKSWVADILSKKELSDAATIMQCTKSAQAVPDALAEHIGPPQWHPGDPRKIYIAQHSRLMQELLSNEESNGETLVYPLSEKSFSIAADKHNSYKANSKIEHPPKDCE